MSLGLIMSLTNPLALVLITWHKLAHTDVMENFKKSIHANMRAGRNKPQNANMFSVMRAITAPE